MSSSIPDKTPKLSLSVVPLMRRHLEQVEAIEKASFSQPWSRRVLEASLLTQRGSAYAALILPSQQLAGYVLLYRNGPDLEIQNLAVHPALRRQGVGGHLLMHALRHARKQGAQQAHLQVRPGNLAALRLYFSLGFQQRGRYPGYYYREGEDALLLSCDLDALFGTSSESL